MASRLSSLRRAAAISRRFISSSSEASTSGRALSACGAGTSSGVHSAYSASSLTQAPGPWPLGPSLGSRLLSNLEAPAAEREEPRPGTYYVEVITGDVRGAGSPAPATITLFGEDGESETHVIGSEDEDSGFERGTHKTYAVYSKDLGRLKRVLVQQLPPPTDPEKSSCEATSAPSTDADWFLDRVEVRTPEGLLWVFPCGGWLGPSGASAEHVGRLARNLIPADHHRDSQRRSSLHDPMHRITRPLHVVASGFAMPHPEKVQAGVKGSNKRGFGHGGEDSYFYAENRNGIYAVGVADGVYEWRDVGIDAGDFSRQLMEYCRQAVELGTTDVLRVLQFAHRHLRRAGTKGSSTVCLALVDTLAGRISAANLGDSGYMLLGRAPGGYRSTAAVGELLVRYRSPQQEHAFGHPYQMGHHAIADAPEDAMLSTMPVYPGDVLIMGSDGLFDNLTDDEIVATVERLTLENSSAQAIAQAISFKAFDASMDRKRMTPYSIEASSAFDMVYSGGKADDISVVACVIE